MKLTMNRITEGSEEVIIRYREMTPQIEAIAAMVQGTEQKLIGQAEKEKLLFSPEDILYLESVDGVTWAYLPDQLCRLGQSLG